MNTGSRMEYHGLVFYRWAEIANIGPSIYGGFARDCRCPETRVDAKVLESSWEGEFAVSAPESSSSEQVARTSSDSFSKEREKFRVCRQVG